MIKDRFGKTINLNDTVHFTRSGGQVIQKGIIDRITNSNIYIIEIEGQYDNNPCRMQLFFSTSRIAVI